MTSTSSEAAVAAVEYSCLVAAQEKLPSMPDSFDWQAYSDLEQFDAGIRRWRNAKMAEIAAADIVGEWSTEQVLAAITRVAEQALQAALDFHQSALSARYGVCVAAQGAPNPFVVLGMGKLGGRELNFSSDIDLICLYEQPGYCGEEAGLSAEEYFSKLVKAVSRSLNQVTEHGFVFRVDLRLRPFGSAGPLAMHFDQAENYYEQHGRDWERYAFIKARPVAGNIAAGEQFLARLRPFIYRRYLDFTALQGLRELKHKIEKQYALKRLDDNVKLGQGGIREVEFIAQSFQLVRGGQESGLQTVSLYQALAEANALGLIDDAAYQALVSGYNFLRTVENRLQQRADQQVHHLPQAEGEQALLANVLGYANWADFRALLATHQQRIHQQFCALLREPEKQANDTSPSPLAPEARKRVEALQQSSSFQHLSERARHYVEVILDRLPGLALPCAAQLAILDLLERILGRTTYLALLAEEPVALERLGFFVGRSRWMAQQVAAQPHLLDDLLDARALETLPTLDEKHDELKGVLTAIDMADQEQVMDAFRRFKHSLQFRIAAADVVGYLPTMRVSDHLTEMAEVVLQQALDYVAEDLQKRTGRPQLERDGKKLAAQLLVVGYGKLGGYELGYGSDLDIVLLHDHEGRALGTDGDKSLDNSVYFHRLGQRLVHFLSANTPAGRLYEVDTRLRPSGASGLLVSSIAAYHKYQQTTAWTWEHQALVRARAVAGPEHLYEQFRSIRQQILTLEKAPQNLRDDVVSMRDKMRAHLDDSTPERYNPKHGKGGMVDIEFICQYLVLANAAQWPCLLQFTDNVRQLSSLQQVGVLTTQEVGQLEQAYISIRSLVHQQKLGVEVAEQTVAASTQQVVAIWQRLLE